MKKSIVALLISGVISGCITTDYGQALDQSNEVHDQITNLTKHEDKGKVNYISQPPVVIEPVAETLNAPWLNTRVSVNVNKEPLSRLLNRLLADTDVSVLYESGVDQNKEVSLVFKGSRKDAIQALIRQSDYGMKPSENSVMVSAFESETFNITLPAGTYSAQLGSQGSAGGGGGETGGSPRVEGQYMNVAYNSVDIFTDIEKGVQAILGENGETGSVKVIPSLSIITVRTTPSRMSQIRSFVSAYEKELAKQVIVDIQVLEFSSNLGSEQGVDWNIVRKVGEHTLNFVIPSTTTVSEGSSFGLAFQGKGGWDGTTALIKALKKQGTVSTQTPITGLILNNHPGKISQTVTQPFISEIKTESEEGVITSDITRDKLSTGVDMMITPNVRDDFVWLRISGKLSKVTNDERETVGDVSVRFLDTQESEINFTNKLRYGQTYVIASVKQHKSQVDKMSQFWMPFLGGRSSLNSTTETLVLLTPRRAE